MIGALLSNTPANLLRSSGVAGVSEPGTGESNPGRDQAVARDSLASSRAASIRAGSTPTLTAEAVVALQDAEQGSRTSGQAAGQAAGQASGEDGGEVSQNPATAAGGDAAQGVARDEDDADGDGLNEAEEKQVQDLKERDREVRAHEQAHARVGGAYASAPSYTFQQGPDGKRYAIGGEVQIDTAKERTPEATIRKMQIVIRAATAPAEPSSQDLKVAQQARSQLAEAQAELRAQQAEELNGGDEDEGPSGISPDGTGASGEAAPAAAGGPEETGREAGGDGRSAERAAAQAAYQAASELVAGRF